MRTGRHPPKTFEGTHPSFHYAFFYYRSFRVCVGPTVGPLTLNKTGGPLGSVLSPPSFSLVMAGFSLQLRQIPDPGFPIYTDDVSTCSKDDSMGHQELDQTGLDVISAYPQETGLSSASEKITFTILGDRRVPNDTPIGTIQLSIGGISQGNNQRCGYSGFPKNSTVHSHA